MTPLTPRQKQVLSYISSYQETNGFVPSLSEIGTALTMPRNSVRRFLSTLKLKGYIQPSPRRSYKITN